MDTPNLKKLAEEAGLPYIVVYQRVKRLNWPIDKALSTPIPLKAAEDSPKTSTKASPTPSEPQDAFFACYGVHFVPGPQSPPWC